MITRAKSLLHMKTEICKQLGCDTFRAAMEKYPKTLSQSQVETALTAGGVPWRKMTAKDKNKMKGLNPSENLARQYKCMPPATRLLIDQCRRNEIARSNSHHGKHQFTTFTLPGTYLQSIYMRYPLIRLLIT